MPTKIPTAKPTGNTDSLLVLAKRVAASFSGRFPPGVTAEDAVQDAALELLVWRDVADKHRPENVPAEAWLVTKVRGVLRDRYGRGWRDNYKMPRVDVFDIPDETDAVAESNLRMDVEEALSHLNLRQRAVVEQVILKGRFQSEVAAEYGVSQAAVSQMMNRAKEHLRGLLGEYE